MKRLAICLLLMIGLVACGDDDSDSASACQESEGAADLIESFSITMGAEKGTAKFALARSGSVGAIVKYIDKGSPMSVRVPFGPRYDADIEHTREVVLADVGQGPLEPGEYSVTLRAFAPDNLNVGEPIDTATRCFEID
jgi:hypothetical protein